LATQAKYEQRLMIQDFALGVRPRIQFIFKRPWSDPYELEHQFNLVNADGTKRPAYFAVQNVCAVFDDTLQPANVRVDCEAPPQANAQVVAFVREHAEFEELVVAVWAGVPAEDESDGRETCRLVIHSDRYRAPVAFDLLQPTPIAARELPCQAAGPQVAVEEVPLRDAPVVVKAFAL
jgi:hypothetical protein